MGLHTTVKRYITDNTKSMIHYSKINDTLRETSVVIEDWLLLLREIKNPIWGHNITTTTVNITNHVRKIFLNNKSCKRYIVVFDCNEHVPICKKIVHDSRSSKTNDSVKAYTPEEIEALKIEKDLKAFLTALPDVEYGKAVQKCLNTRPLRNALIFFVCDIISKISARDIGEGYEIIIDGANDLQKGSFTLFSKTEQTEGGLAWNRREEKGNVLGEGDLKIPYWITKQEKGSKIQILSKDSDMIVILSLLEYTQRKKYNKAQWFRMFLELGCPRGTFRETLDISELFLNIKNDFGKKTSSVIVFLVLAIACGGDYPQLASKTKTLVGLPFISFTHYVSAMRNTPSLHEYIYAKATKNTEYGLSIYIEKCMLCWTIIYIYINIRADGFGYAALQNKDHDKAEKDFKIFENEICGMSKDSNSFTTAKSGKNRVPNIHTITIYACMVSWTALAFASWEDRPLVNCVEKTDGLSVHGWAISSSGSLVIADEVYWK